MVDTLGRLKKQRLRRKFRCRRLLKTQVSSAPVRVVVFRSNKAIYAQAVNLVDGRTLCGISSWPIKGDDKPVDKARKVGVALGSRLLELSVDRVVFDRSGYKYHGRIAAVVDGLREVGISV